MKQLRLLLIGLLTGLQLSAQADADSLVTMAQKHFEHIRQLCTQPQAQLWGRELMGPVLLADPV